MYWIPYLILESKVKYTLMARKANSAYILKWSVFIFGTMGAYSV